FDGEHAVSLEHDVDLVVLVRLLAVGLRCDQDVDAEFEAWGGVDHLVAAGLSQPFPDGFDVERVRDLEHRTGGFVVWSVGHSSTLSPFRRPGGRSTRSIWTSERSHEKTSSAIRGGPAR